MLVHGGLLLKDHPLVFQQPVGPVGRDYFGASGTASESCSDSCLFFCGH